LCFSADGARVAACGWFSHSDGTKLWDTITGEEVISIPDPPGAASVLIPSYSSDGKTLTFVSGDANSSRLHILDAATCTLVDSVRVEGGRAGVLAYHAESKRVANHGLSVWDATTGKKNLTLKGHTSGILAAAFSADGKRLFSFDESGTLKQWD